MSDDFDITLERKLESKADGRGGGVRDVRGIELITGAGRRRRWSSEDKGRIIEESLANGVSVSEVARRHGLSPQQLFAWRREARASFHEAGSCLPPATLISYLPIVQRLTAHFGNKASSLLRTGNTMQEDRQQDSLNGSLVDAVKARSLDRVRELLRAGADPSHWGKPWGRTPLHYAAMLGFEEIAEALLAADADPDRADFNGVKPFGAASLAGHHRTAGLIRDWLSRRGEERTHQQLDRLGWPIGPIGVRKDEAELILAGTRKVDDSDRIIELSVATEPFRIDVPFTSFDGWIKQIVPERAPPIAREAFEAAFPWFLDLAVPPEKMLASIPEEGKAWRFSGRRPRRFAGDDALPRSRYYTLCKDESGNDAGTLVCEIWAYSHIARTGEIELIDTADPTASKRLAKLGLETPANKSILVVFSPGPKSGVSPFLLHTGLPQRVVAFPIPMQTIHERIDKVVDLRIPDTADWFARVVSQAVLHLHSPSTDRSGYYKCWPFRPPLDNFGQLLPAMLTQELGGGVLSVAAGALLRRAGANALVFPSARNDPRLRVQDGKLGWAKGWNLVDYRKAPPPKQMIVLDVDRSWPDNVRLGPGFSLRDGRPGPDFLFKNVTIEYEDSGRYRGCFEVDGIVKALALLRAMELQTFCNNETLPPWWVL
jgi:transposase-like protein